jgi:hypothetical protein
MSVHLRCFLNRLTVLLTFWLLGSAAVFCQDNNCDLPAKPFPPGTYYINSAMGDNRYLDKKSQDDDTMQFYFSRPGSRTQLFQFENVDRGCWTIRVLSAPGIRHLAMADSPRGVFGIDREVIARDINEQVGPLLDRHTISPDQLSDHWRVLSIGNGRYNIQLIHRGTEVIYNNQVVGGAHLPGGPVVVEGCLNRRNPDNQGRAQVSYRCTGIIEEQFRIESSPGVDAAPPQPKPPEPVLTDWEPWPGAPLSGQPPGPEWIGFENSSNKDRESELHNLVGNFRRVSLAPTPAEDQNFIWLCQKVSKNCSQIIDWQGHRGSCNEDSTQDGSRLALCSPYLTITIPANGTNKPRFLSVSPAGSTLSLSDVDDGSGRQHWQLLLSRRRYHNILTFGASANGPKYLSVEDDGTVDLSDRDDGSGHQRFNIGFSDGSIFPFYKASRPQCVSLGASADGTKVVCVSSGRHWALGAQ